MARMVAEVQVGVIGDSLNPLGDALRRGKIMVRAALDINKPNYATAPVTTKGGFFSLSPPSQMQRGRGYLLVCARVHS